MVERYGAQAVFGRMLGVGEMRRMAAADKVYRAYMARKQSGDNWVQWSTDNPDGAKLLELGAYLNRENHG